MRLDQGLKDARQRVITRLQLQTPANMQARDMTVCQMKMIFNSVDTMISRRVPTHAHTHNEPCLSRVLKVLILKTQENSYRQSPELGLALSL